MNYMSDFIRDCTKAKQTSFNDVSLALIQGIEAKTINKNISLYNSANKKLFERHKTSKSEQTTQDNNSAAIKKALSDHTAQSKQINYLQAYKGFKPQVYLKASEFKLQLDKLDEKDEEMTFRIYTLLKKKKTIFKVEEIQRKLNSKQDNIKTDLKECDCCGKIGKHRCKHNLCQKKCPKLLNRIKKVDSYHSSQKPFQVGVFAQQINQGNRLERTLITQSDIKLKQQVEQVPTSKINREPKVLQLMQQQEFEQQPQPQAKEPQRMSEEQNSEISSKYFVKKESEEDMEKKNCSEQLQKSKNYA